MNKTITVQQKDNGKRLDRFLHSTMTVYSRTQLQKAIKKGDIVVNDIEVKAHTRLSTGDVISITMPVGRCALPQPEDIPLSIVFENDDLAIVDKPAGIVVHPSKEGHHMSGSMVNALLYHWTRDALSNCSGILRPGIVHRLDKDTSGLLIIAKNNAMHAYLKKCMKKRNITKKYTALVRGRIPHKTGTIDAPITRDTRNRKKMSLAMDNQGKQAITHYEIKAYYQNCTLLEAHIVTGRTHQIRVHCASIGHPVAGDGLYGDNRLNESLSAHGLTRQFLHARELAFVLPDGEKIHVTSKLPSDLTAVLESISNK
ncbi:RluA family pseudouridine synthase [Candidatus Peregrinibacteria bacterium]|nr:RluA family pseudouridine synthase [Candidatus Peregrinibacteria bacterium]